MQSISLNVVLGRVVPSFKNSKRAIRDKNTGLMRTLTPGKIKRRMDHLESTILSALYFECQTAGSGTALECLKQWQTALSGLSDDSLKEIPEFSFGMEKVSKGNEGVQIIITPL